MTSGWPTIRSNTNNNRRLEQGKVLSCACWRILKIAGKKRTLTRGGEREGAASGSPMSCLILSQNQSNTMAPPPRPVVGLACRRLTSRHPAQALLLGRIVLVKMSKSRTVFRADGRCCTNTTKSPACGSLGIGRSGRSLKAVVGFASSHLDLTIGQHPQSLMSGPLKRQLAAVAPLAKRARPSEPAALVVASPPVASIASSSNTTRAAFIASLLTEPTAGRTVAERELLQLECESMDESWLTLLQGELRKEYFLALKSFLWTEGVRGVKDSKKGKVFPAGESRGSALAVNTC